MISTIIVQAIGMYLGKINFTTKNVTKLAFLTSFLVLTCPILAPSVLADTNLVLNPGLESGTTTPLNWTFVNQGVNTPIWDSVSHSGSRSIKINIPGTKNVISGYPQSDMIDAQPLSIYSASVWGKTQNTGGSNTPAARIVELDADKNWIRQNNILPVFGRGTNDWAQRTVEFQTSANTRYLYVYANIWNGYGNFWMDDVTVSLKTPTPTPAPNLVLNPGLEIGTTTPLNWTFVNKGANTPILDSVSHSGSRSIKISIPGTTNVISGYLQSDIIDAQPLSTYTASVWGKTQNTGGSNTPAARVVELDADQKWIRQNNIIPVFGRGTNDWAQRTVEFQTSANTRYLYIYANIWNGYGDFWMDDVELSLKNPPTPTLTPTPIQTPAPTPAVNGWNLVWSDEFDGTSIDANKWEIFEGETEPFGDSCFTPNALTVNGGMAHLGIMRTPTTCYSTDQYGNGGKLKQHNYAGAGFGVPTTSSATSTSNIILSQGRWETRARFPKGAGTTAYILLWPANDEWTAEIDFAEAIGSNKNEMTFTQHWDGTVSDKSEEVSLAIDITQYHVYAVEMKNNQLKWYVDGNLIATQTQKFAPTLMGFSAGTWAGNCSNDWPGCPTGTTLPVYMDIDYVRVYT